MNSVFAISRRHRRSASTLAATMIVVLMIVTFLSAAALLTSQYGRFNGRQAGDTDLMAAADAGLEYAYAQWKQIAAATFTRGSTTGPVTSDFPTTMATSINGTSLPFAAQGITFNTLSLVLTDQNGTPISSNPAPGTPTSNVPGYPGWTGTTFNYLATVAVTSNTHYGFSASNQATMTLRRYFQVTRVPLFQAAIFYENKLEIHPGAAMTVTGLVHTNNELWARGFDKLQFKSNVSYVGAYHEVGDSSITHGWDGTNYGIIPGVGSYAAVPLVTWSDGQTSNNSATKATQLNQVSPIDPFGGQLTASNNGLHDIVEKPTAAPNLTSPQIAYNNASLIITINSSLATNNANRLVITDGSGNALNSADTVAVKNALNSGTTTTIYDQREASNIVVTTLDMAKLAVATVGTGTPLQRSFAGTGLVYIHDVSPATSTEPAIKLINGRNLGQDVTIASDNAVYIQGDYNTGGTSASSVPSNNSNPDGTAVPQAAGYTRYASAVMADAVTILSNSWADSKSNQSLSNRTATATTVNTAILAGDVASNLNGNGTASGGAHNFPRFLENWSGVNFTYWGSLVEAFHSEEFTGLWQTGNVYYWPDRKWNFDTAFINKQPPGVPNGIQYSRGRWQRN